MWHVVCFEAVEIRVEYYSGRPLSEHPGGRDLVVDGRMTLKWILEKQHIKVLLARNKG